MLEDSPLVSAGKAALVSASAALGLYRGPSSNVTNGGVGAKAGRVAESVSVTKGLEWSTLVCGGKYKDENGGGRGDVGVEEDEEVKNGGLEGGLVTKSWSSFGREEGSCVSAKATDEPALGSRGTDKVMTGF